MPTLMEKAALIAKALGIPSSVLDRDGIAGVVRGASAAIGFRPKESMTLGDILDAIAGEVGFDGEEETSWLLLEPAV